MWKRMRHRSRADLSQALELLQERGVASVMAEATGGRPVERWAITAREQSAESDIRAEDR